MTLAPAFAAPATVSSATVTQSPARVLEALHEALPDLAADAALCDITGAFPRAGVAMLREIGALETFAQEGPTPAELMQALRLTGRASLSLGRIFEGHVNGARLVAWYGDASQRRRVAEDLASGRLFGVWNTEPAPGVTLSREAGAPMLQGSKSYATGAGHIDRAIITATLDDGARQMLVVEATDPARADASGWTVSGMKATVSGTYDLTGLAPGAYALVGSPGDYLREPRFTAGAWRFTAVQLGGIERILTLVRDQLATTSAGNSPLGRARFAEALAATRSAALWVRQAAQRAEAADAGDDEIALVLMTRGVVERAGLQVIEAAQRTVGTRAFFAENPLDHACRDLALYLRQPAPDQALDRAAEAFITRDAWREDPLW